MTVQNKYVGDVGDFGKYGLLRYLCSDVEASGFLPSLGVIWYLVPDEAHSRDGGFIGYLKPTETNEERFKACDPLLYDALQRIVDNKSRSVANIRRDGVLPNETRFFVRMDVLTFEVLRGGIEIRHRRVARRAEWFQRALSATESCDIVFFGSRQWAGGRGWPPPAERHQVCLLRRVDFPCVRKGIKAWWCIITWHGVLQQRPKSETGCSSCKASLGVRPLHYATVEVAPVRSSWYPPRAIGKAAFLSAQLRADSSKPDGQGTSKWSTQLETDRST